ncbi:MAG: transporter substrate-binding domain-containing protein [Pseudomonadales bacterium]|nr:transporter substrate-binding domain-containing protein [Pseudomonadales bacterium]
MGLKWQFNSLSWQLFRLAGLFWLFLPFQVNAERLSLVTFLERPLVESVNGKPAGVVVDVVSEMMRRAGMEYNIQLVPPKRALMVAQRTQHHCVFPIERSQEREVFFHWVRPVLISRHALYSAPDRPIRLQTLSDVQPYVIGSFLGSGVGEYLESFGYTLDYASRNELNIAKLQKRRIDLWASDVLSATYLARENNVKLNDPELIFFTTVRAMACNLDTDATLIDHLQVVLTGMYRDGTVDKLTKYAQAPR